MRKTPLPLFGATADEQLPIRARQSGRGVRRPWATTMEIALTVETPGPIELFRCPVCSHDVRTRRDRRGIAWVCDDCGAHGDVHVR